jgi:hypothetical protein
LGAGQKPSPPTAGRPLANAPAVAAGFYLKTGVVGQACRVDSGRNRRAGHSVARQEHCAHRYVVAGICALLVNQQFAVGVILSDTKTAPASRRPLNRVAREISAPHDAQVQRHHPASQTVPGRHRRDKRGNGRNRFLTWRIPDFTLGSDTRLRADSSFSKPTHIQFSPKVRFVVQNLKNCTGTGDCRRLVSKRRAICLRKAKLLADKSFAKAKAGQNRSGCYIRLRLYETDDIPAAAFSWTV